VDDPGVDLKGHGTHVAGIIGALDNGTNIDGQDVVGVAPGARIVSARSSSGSQNAVHTGTTVACALDFLTARNLNADPDDDVYVANLSASAYELSSGSADGPNCGRDDFDDDPRLDEIQIMHRAVCGAQEAGLVLVVSAGNLGANAAQSAPQAFDQVITVSAMVDRDGLPGGLAGGPDDDTFYNLSNLGADVDLAAPGVDILSTYKDGGYAEMTGTSMAAPHVAGAAALYFATHSSATPPSDNLTNVRDALRANREDVALPGDPDGINEGILNVNDGFPWADFLPLPIKSVVAWTTRRRSREIALKSQDKTYPCRRRSATTKRAISIAPRA
jgi:subtilisin family serine protease